jgi:hypothetical protein
VVAITPSLVHIGYALMLCALLARDVLWLRLLLVGAQGLLAVYAWRMGVPSIAAWNVVFTAINTAWVAVILRERRAVTLPPDLVATYTRHFAALAPPEFLRLWRQGHREVLRDGDELVRAGGDPDALYFLLAGKVRVTRKGMPVTELPAGFFVAEMSLLTGHPANADVAAMGEVEAVRWAVADLRAIRQGNAQLWTKVQSVIGHDIVQKIQRA